MLEFNSGIISSELPVHAFLPCIPIRMAQIEKAKEILNNTNGLDYKGVVPYSEVLEKINSSDLLVLAESTSPIISRLTAYGFSTKITDYLFSGIPVLAYGSVSNVGISYLSRTKTAMVVTDKKELFSSIKTAVMDKEWREDTVARALKIANKNHDASNNVSSFRKYLQRVVGHE